MLDCTSGARSSTVYSRLHKRVARASTARLMTAMPSASGDTFGAMMTGRISLHAISDSIAAQTRGLQVDDGWSSVTSR